MLLQKDKTLNKATAYTCLANGLFSIINLGADSKFSGIFEKDKGAQASTAPKLTTVLIEKVV